MGSGDSGKRIASRPEKKEDRRRGGWLWLAGAAGAGLLVLGVNGTLGAWSTAIINNDQPNTVSAADSVALVETSTGSTSGGPCSTVGAGSDKNVVSCDIDLYGNSTLDPDVTTDNVETVQFENLGSAAGDLTLTAQACENDTDAVGEHDLCDEVDVQVECSSSGGETYDSDATATAGAKSLTGLATATSGGDPVANLDSDGGETLDCTVTVTMPDTAPADVASQTATQVLVWTLTA